MLIVIDDSVDTVPNDVSTDAFVLTRHEAGVIRPSRGERRVWELPPASSADVPPAHVETFLRLLPVWLPPVGYLGALVGSLLFRLLQSLVYGAAAMAYARRARVNLDYTSAIRLATVAVTPVVVIRTLIWFGPWEPAWYWRWPATLLITAGYLAFGIRAAAGSAQPLSQSA